MIQESTIRKWVGIAEKLAEQHGGLPHPDWLIKNGYWSLYFHMRNNQKRFSHIKKNTVLKGTKQKGHNEEKYREWLKIATQISKRYGGFLPNDAEIMRLGHNALNAYMRRYPHLFSQFKRRPTVNKISPDKAT